MKRTIIQLSGLLLTGLALVAVPAQAGYEAGVKAYQHKDYTRALRELQGDPTPASNYVLGIMYFKGEGVQQNKKGAIDLLRKAADKGHVQAQYSLAVICDKGDGIVQDQREAARWYRKAAEQGHARSQFDLGVMYANGEGITKDRAEAVKWLRKAAGQGHARAQKLLEVMGEG